MTEPDPGSSKTSIYRRDGKWVVERIGLVSTVGDGTLDEAITFLRMQCEMEERMVPQSDKPFGDIDARLLGS